MQKVMMIIERPSAAEATGGRMNPCVNSRLMPTATATNIERLNADSPGEVMAGAHSVTVRTAIRTNASF